MPTAARDAARAIKRPTTTSSSSNEESSATSSATAPASASAATARPATRAGPRRNNAVPGRRAGDQYAGQQAKAAWELAHRHHDSERDRGHYRHQCNASRKSSFHRTPPLSPAPAPDARACMCVVSCASAVPISAPASTSAG